MSSTYCTDANIRAVFGSDNIDKWSDLDNDESAGSMAARVTVSIAKAGDWIDSRMRSSKYIIPLQTQAAATPPEITEIAATYAGVWMAQARGLERFQGDNEHPVFRHLARITAMLDEIAIGKRRIDAI